jgi:hypothetical protein
MTRGFPCSRSGDVELTEPVTYPVQVLEKPFVRKADPMVGAIDKEISGASAIYPTQPFAASPTNNRFGETVPLV